MQNIYMNLYEMSFIFSLPYLQTFHYGCGLETDKLGELSKGNTKD